MRSFVIARLVIKIVVLDMPITIDAPMMPYFLKLSSFPKYIQIQPPNDKQAPIK